MGARQAATYGLSRRLGGVEFLGAHFTAHRFAPHSHAGFAVGAVRSGACRIWHRGESYVARRGDLVLIDPGAAHSADPEAGDTWDYCAVYLPVETARAWRRGTDRMPAFRAVVARDEDLASRLEWLCAALGRDAEDPRVELAFAPFVEALFDRLAGDRDARPDEAERAENGGSIAWTARHHLDAHFTEPVRIEDLAALTGRSPFAIIRAFSREFGISPYAYLTHRRVARAQELLRAGRRISDTAFSVGFSDQSHLTRFFRRVVGVPPGVWLRGVMAAGAPAASAPAARHAATH